VSAKKEARTRKMIKQFEDRGYPYSFYMSIRSVLKNFYSNQASQESLKEDLKFTPANQYAILHVNLIADSSKHFIVQLINNQNTIIQEISNQKEITFKTIPPGKEYRLRVLVDANNDGYWQPGNIFEFQPPEPVIFYEDSEGIQTFPFRANWEVGPFIIQL
ncbi:MAG: hypothetical protein R3345_15410, partial [Fulvivirga sp.]|nr:hypothetical protein [Fulvivirga sp.]